MNRSGLEIDRLADRLRALGDSTRLHILNQLGHGECCQCDINEELGIPQPLLSFHMKVLREAGVVRERRRGRRVFYSLRREPITEIETFLGDLNDACAASSCCSAPGQVQANPTN
jgi:ArsR family transcriptional regulator